MSDFLVVLGTRPEVIKLAPVVRELRARAGAEAVKLCSTAQHRELLDEALAAFELEPDLDLGLMRANQSLCGLMGRMALALEPVLAEIRPRTVIVQGDTLTVMVAALAAFLCGARVAHVEAGLRTGDKRAPFPEEVSRRVAGVVADLHFAPTPAARAALMREGVDPKSVRVTGNTGIDALLWMRERAAGRALPAGLGASGRRLVLVTAHRRESFGAPLREAFGALRELAERFPALEIAYPVHPNPNVRAAAEEVLGGHERIRLLAPLAYPDLCALLARAELVITDSGGLQEEAPSLGKPVLVLRESTERPEAVTAGVAVLVGTDRARILSEASRLLADPELLRSFRPRALYGDGLAARRIAETLLGAERTPEFEPQAG